MIELFSYLLIVKYVIIKIYRGCFCIVCLKYCSITYSDAMISNNILMHMHVHFATGLGSIQRHNVRDIHFKVLLTILRTWVQCMRLPTALGLWRVRCMQSYSWIYMAVSKHQAPESQNTMCRMETSNLVILLIWIDIENIHLTIYEIPIQLH